MRFISNALAFEPKRTCVFQADKKRYITDRFSVNGTRVTRRRGLIVKKFDISEIESTRLKKGLFGEKIEFYVKGKCIAKVSTNNQPYDLLDKRIRKEHILRKR